MTDKPAILYIDDDEGLRRLTRRALERRGFRVELAASGAEGVAKAAETRFDLVAVDHYMPGQDGLATLAALRELPETPPVIYVTGSEESRIAVAALKAGAIDYVVKSVSDDFFDLLARAVEQGLETVRLRNERDRAEERLRESNERLQSLLHEVNHRVANSLQLASAFVHLQSREVADEAARAVLADTQQRIQAIAQVHKRLYTSDSVEVVDMKDYLGSLIDELAATWSTSAAPRSLTLEADPIRLATDKAVAVGIIVTELVSNACKYAYAEDCSGAVRIEFAADGEDHFRLCVQDDGRGMQDGEIKGTGLGTKLIGSMAAQLRSSVDYEPRAVGVSAVLRAAR
ncbi:sensor histidine kinase [Sphingomonas quercus]|nr:response regulator [Sphingomonas quercus]